MFNQILPFLLIYFFIIFSILGYGSTLIRILENKITLINIINTSRMTLVNIFVVAISTAIIMQVIKDIIQ